MEKQSLNNKFSRKSLNSNKVRKQKIELVSEYRMYGLVPYNISEIQKGIQFGHAVVEYAQKHFKDADYQMEVQPIMEL